MDPRVSTTGVIHKARGYVRIVVARWKCDHSKFAYMVFATNTGQREIPPRHQFHDLPIYRGTRCRLGLWVKSSIGAASTQNCRLIAVISRAPLVGPYR